MYFNASSEVVKNLLRQSSAAGTARSNRDFVSEAAYAKFQLPPLFPVQTVASEAPSEEGGNNT